MLDIIDQQTDTSQRTLVKAAAKLHDSTFAEKVLTTAVGPLEKVASNHYAWTEQRLFPVNTVENTLLSKVYFDHQREKIASEVADRISEKLDTFLNLHDIPEGIFERKPEEKTACEREPQYLLPSMKMCKVTTPEDLEKTASLFQREHQKLPLSKRVEFSTNFIKTASEFGVDQYPDVVAKYAGTKDTDFTTVLHMLEFRKSAATLKGLDGKEYTKLAETLEKVEGIPNADELTKLAYVIDELDRKYGLDDPKYDKKLPCPFSVVFNKEAVDEDLDEVKELDKANVVARYGENALEAIEDEKGELDYRKLKDIVNQMGGSL